MVTAALAAWLKRAKARLTGGPGRRRPFRRPRLEGLEDRACPSAFTPGDYLVVTGNGTANTLSEYTPANALVQSFNIPLPGSSPDEARDVTVGTDGRAYVYNGTFSPELAMLDPVTGNWTSTTYPGWSTVNNLTYGGVGHYGQYVFASDMYTYGAADRGIIRFDTAAGAAQRFADTTDFISLAVGLDGYVYGLLGAAYNVYDPTTMALIRSVSLLGGPPDPRGIAADAAGDVFLANSNGYLYHLSPTGQVLASLNTNPPNGSNFFFSIDVKANGQIVAGDGSGDVIHTDESLSSFTTSRAGTHGNFVAFVPGTVGPIDHFVVSGFPSSTTAGSAGSITVTADDASGHVVTGYAGTVHFSSSDGQAVLPADYTFQASDDGTHTFSNAVTLKTAGTQSVTVADLNNSAVQGSETNIAVSPAAASSFRVAGYPSPATAGVAQTVNVTALDAYGNTATGYAGTVHLTSSDGQAALPPDGTLTGGTGSFGVTLKTAGTQSVTATDTVNGSITGAETGITVNPAAASQLLVTTQPPPSVFAGAGFGLAVSAEDPYGNLATGFSGSVAVALANNPGGAALGGSTSASASKGVATFSGLTLNQPGSGYTLQATSSGLSPATSNSFAVYGPALSSTSVLELRPVGTVVGTLSTGEPGSGHTYTYALVSGAGSTDNGAFTISGNQLLTADAFNAGAKSSYSARVRSTDEANNVMEVPFTITITDDPALALSNGTLTVSGTSGNDAFSFAPGSPQDTMRLNGTALAVDAAAAKSVVFNGGGGSDSATLNGASGGGNTLTGTPGSTATLSGPGYSVTVNGVDQVVAPGHFGDRAYLSSTSLSSAVFVATPTDATLRSSDPSLSHFLTEAKNFSVVLVSGSGGTAYLYDSPGNDFFVGTPTYSYLYGAGFFNQVNNFGNVVATSSAGGTDDAYLFGGSAASPAVFVATPTYAYLYGLGPQNEAVGFKVVVGTGSGTGSNAYLYGSPAGGNVLVGTSSYSYLYGAGFFYQAQGFQNVTGVSGGAGDLAYLFDTAGGEFVATSTYAYVTGAGQTEQADGFHTVHGYSGGGDSAYLYGTMTAADTYVNGGSYAYLYGDAFFALEAGFASVYVNPNARR